MHDKIKAIQWAYQRARYGYDERIMWGFDDYIGQFIKPLREFCLKKLSDSGFVKHNEIKAEILKKTIIKIDAYWKEGTRDSQEELWRYIALNIGTTGINYG